MNIHVEIGCAYWELSHVNDKNTLCYLVEALADHCKKLEEKFSNNNTVIIENSAISTENGPKHFYRYSRDKARKHDVPHAQWLEGTCGFDPMRSDDPRACGDKIKKLNLKIYDKITVNCLTWRSLLKKHGITKIDSLKIDTEGHDLEIINQIDFLQLGIKKLQFEHFLVKKRTPEQYNAAIDSLKKIGFRIKDERPHNLHLER